VDSSLDQADVDRVLGGDVSAFEGIVRRWQGPLINLGYRFCRDRGRAEEMAQEAFLRAYRSLGQWNRKAKFSTWLFTVATHLYCSELRRFPANTVPLDEIAELRERNSFSDRLEDQDRDDSIRRAVYSLAPKYREVLILFYFHEKSVAAAAQSLSLPEGTVKARLSRGRAILRNKLSRLTFAAEMEEIR
jgi:RNA polymerase sigma-70 factor (ECF subfamily)